MDNTQKSFRERVGATVQSVADKFTGQPKAAASGTASVLGTTPAPPAGASLRTGDWQSPTNTRPIAAPASPKASGLLKPMSDAVFNPSGQPQATGLRGTVAKVGNAVKFAKGATLPVAAMASAFDSYNTDSKEFGHRTGIDVDSTGGEFAARLAGTLGDFGNAVTFGGADRLGNLMAGNGFNRTPDYDPTGINTPKQATPTQSSAPSGTDLRESTLRQPTQASAPAIPNIKSLRDMGTSPAARLPSGVLVERDPTTGTRNFTGQGNNPNGANYIAPTSSDPGALQRSLDSMERQSVLGKQIHALRLAELDKDALMSGGQSYGGGQGGVSSLREPAGRGRLVSGVTLANRQAQATLDQQRELSQQGMRTTLRGQDLQATNNAEGHAVQRENNANSIRASMYGRDASLAMSKAQMDIARMNHQDTLRQQGIENKRADRTLGNAEEKVGEEQLQKLLEVKNPGSDGKPDANRVAAMRSSMESSMADLGISHAQISKSGMAREQLMAGATLIDRVNSHASNFNPFMADFMKTVKPHQLLNMKRLPNGDAQTPDFVGPDGRKTPGQVIPARFFTNKEANRFMPGTPTDEFSNLFAKEPK